jgi:hypothetical protein
MRFAISRGCPEGGVLSPILWCLVVDDLLDRLSDSGVFLQGYAYDLRFLTVDKILSTVSGPMQLALSTVEKRRNEVGISVTAAKTGRVEFSRKRKLQELSTPRFFGDKFSLIRSVNYLRLF